jgi:tRNA-dihydrouridine synthase A
MSSASAIAPHRFCTAPMLDHTDRHCRYFFRQLSHHALLYTEMITSGALLHGDAVRHLDFDPAEHPLALQLGGSDPNELARCAKLAEQWGYDEINLNVGCPSERVQRGAFGACLMAEPELVADCVKAMREASALPVTVKHRIGIDATGADMAAESYDFMRDFVGVVGAAGCTTFIVHARKAILRGLSPKDNRQIPPLKYAYVYRLKREFPSYSIIINGGIDDWHAIEQHLPHVDGVMLGRAIYHDPYLLADVDRRCYDPGAATPSREQVVAAMVSYAEQAVAHGTLLRNITRHMLGLFHHLPGARNWRRMLSDAQLLRANDPTLLLRALDAVRTLPFEERGALALADG